MEDWSGVAAAYERSFARLCAGTIGPLLDEARGDRLLDIGCGTGDLVAEASRRGFVVEGVDAAPGMVALAHRRAPGRVRRAALPELPYGDGAFDTVLANFVLNHVPDPRAATRELARVTAPGGRVLTTIWPAGGAGWGSLTSEVFAEAGVVALPTQHLPADLDFPRTADGLAGLAADAQLAVISAREVTWDWRVRPADLWAGIEGGVATVGETFAAQSAAIQDRARAVFRARTDHLGQGEDLSFPCRAALLVAQR